MGRLWVISDTHGKHAELTPPKNIDAVLHAGDAAHPRDPVFNEMEFRKAMDWYSSLDIPIKLFSPGNHDTAFESYFVEREEYKDITFLVNETFTLFGKKLYASPYTPLFGNWVYMLNQEKIRYNWNAVPVDTQILVTHGPPFGVRDLASGRHKGCPELKDVVDNYLPELEYHIFGHFHSWGPDKNAGVTAIKGVTYVNASVVDIKGTRINNGIILEI